MESNRRLAAREYSSLSPSDGERAGMRDFLMCILTRKRAPEIDRCEATVHNQQQQMNENAARLSLPMTPAVIGELKNGANAPENANAVSQPSSNLVGSC